jgi:hypothetical protein
LSFTKNISTATLDVTVDVVKSGTEIRAWSPAACNGANTYASIDWSAGGVNGSLGLEVTLNRTINRAKAITLTKLSGTTKTWNATDDVVVTGTRYITWAAPTTSGTLINRVKTVTSNVSRVRTFTRASGVSASSTATVTVGTLTPLNVTVARNNTNYGLVSKTINSGTVKVTETSDGSYSSCVFTDVVYNLLSSNSNKCVPTSGTITCGQYASSAVSSGTATVVIKFGVLTTASGISVSVDGATAEDFSEYNTKGCDLEFAT